MTTSELKLELHWLIETIDDADDLHDLYESIVVFKEQRIQPELGDTSPERINRLQQALRQAQDGQPKTQKQFLQEMQSWRRR